ncbi:MAG: tRNA guanosine(34) transglycosylase Tgt [Candidatus Woesebacteria bacterium]|nr:MAG: tRNA guanosine(34) transglycosylase Tgt [Candidatus Woesebacteria bacterium]
MKKFGFKIIKKDEKTKARSAVIHTAHGDIKTPAFSPVATKASVKSLDPNDIKLTKSQVVLGNTYHLYLRPGTKIIDDFGGFAPFMGWSGPTITDSGGYQVSFLRGVKPKITDKGATFRSHIDGSKHLITPESSMEIQKSLNADIIMAFDQPLPSNAPEKKKKEAFIRTLKWEERSFLHWKKIKSTQALFGIVQGDLDKDLRRESLKFILDFDFPGIALGGESIGVSPQITSQTLDTIVDLLPDDKPVHALGLGGGVEGILESIERGVDIFDNTSVTRMARTGLLFIYPEDGGTRQNKFRYDLTKSKFKDNKNPISKVCNCYTCQNFSSSYIHHLLVSNEILGARLATIHNITFINNLMDKIRNSIENSEFQVLKSHWLNRS